MLNLGLVSAIPHLQKFNFILSSCNSRKWVILLQWRGSFRVLVINVVNGGLRGSLTVSVWTMQEMWSMSWKSRSGDLSSNFHQQLQAFSPYPKWVNCRRSWERFFLKSPIDFLQLMQWALSDFDQDVSAQTLLRNDGFYLKRRHTYWKGDRRTLLSLYAPKSRFVISPPLHFIKTFFLHFSLKNGIEMTRHLGCVQNPEPFLHSNRCSSCWGDCIYYEFSLFSEWWYRCLRIHWSISFVSTNLITCFSCCICVLVVFPGVGRAGHVPESTGAGMASRSFITAEEICKRGTRFRLIHQPSIQSFLKNLWWVVTDFICRVL